MTAKPDSDRFQSGADKYAAYLETPAGRLRCGLAFANLQDFLVLPQSRRSLRGLDLGCGTGATAVRLARLGIHMTLLDSSSAMLDIAKRAARKAGVDGKIALNHGDAAQVANLFPAGSFDVVLCHNILEYVDDPVAVLRGAARAMRDSSAILSLIVRNQAGEVRLFTAESLQVMLMEASLAVTAKRGLRVVSDYLPPRVSLSAEYERIFELELKLGRRPEFAAVARYTQCLVRCTGPVTEDGA